MGSSLGMTGGGRRGRILAALAELACERGIGRTSVGGVVARAGVSTGTFYEEFSGLEECFVAVVDLGLALPPELIVRAFAGEEDWRDGMRAALAALLEFFDREPQLTQVWFCEILAAGTWALEHRERNIALVRSVIVEYWWAAASLRADPVLAKGVMAAVFDVLTTHVVTRREEPFITLLAPLTSLVISPLSGAADASEQVQRAEEHVRELLARPYPPAERTLLTSTADPEPPGCKRPTRRRTLRAVQCLRFLASRPGASNSEIASAIGVKHRSQISRLLSELKNEGHLTRISAGTGRRNAWRLTEQGERTAGVDGVEGGQSAPKGP
jgi:AcrR family transcriptional regulator